MSETKVYICRCGARSDEPRSDMFSGGFAVRVHDVEGITVPWLECKKCGHRWNIDERD